MVQSSKLCNMDSNNMFFQDLYENFNERKIEIVISKMADNVKWANGMEGGFVYGHEGVKEYWTRQFKLIKSNVTPLEIEVENETAKIKVHQVVYDLNGKLLADELVYHYFQLADNKIVSFEIGEKF